MPARAAAARSSVPACPGRPPPPLLTPNTMRNALRTAALAAVLSASVLSAQAHSPTPSLQITEWLYNSASDEAGEFIELTNMGATALDLSGWSFDDADGVAGALDLSSLGTLAVGESVLIAEVSADAFRAAWGLAASVKVLGHNTHNFGRADTINVFDASAALVDRLVYGDQALPGTIRTQFHSGNPVSLAALQPQTVAVANWVLASVGDAYGSYASSFGDVGNPGRFVYAPVPEPETYALMLAGVGVLGAAHRARRARAAA